MKNLKLKVKLDTISSSSQGAFIVTHSKAITSRFADSCISFWRGTRKEILLKKKSNIMKHLLFIDGPLGQNKNLTVVELLKNFVIGNA